MLFFQTSHDILDVAAVLQIFFLFKQEHADDFYNSYNNQPFNMIEPETCHLVYVAKVESVKEGEVCVLIP